jgi:hypothetical protein
METGRSQIRDGAAIKLILHPSDQGIHRRCIRPSSSHRRHHARPKFPDDFFSDFRVVAKMRKVQLIQK